jgi:hypothetical protein
MHVHLTQKDEDDAHAPRIVGGGYNGVYLDVHGRNCSSASRCTAPTYMHQSMSVRICRHLRVYESAAPLRTEQLANYLLKRLIYTKLVNTGTCVLDTGTCVLDTCAQSCDLLLQGGGIPAGEPSTRVRAQRADVVAFEHTCVVVAT